MSKKEKLLQSLRERSKSFTWADAVTLMKAHGFTLHSAPGGGAGRMFRHTSGIKVRLHEPHPRKTLLPYMMDQLLEGLANAGEID